VNGKLIFKADTEEENFLGALYKINALNYPKFFKMDRLCKLGILATELLIRNTPDFDTFPKKEIALVFANNSSSLESDRIHAQAIADKQHYFPSPSVFVYTLPNIVIGEIAIKHKITGENSFFVSEKFDEIPFQTYTDLLLRDGIASTVLGGWINADGKDLEAFVYCVKNLNFKQENINFSQPHNSENLKHLYSLEDGSTGNH